jgi:hypothetical protein
MKMGGQLCDPDADISKNECPIRKTLSGPQNSSGQCCGEEVRSKNATADQTSAVRSIIRNFICLIATDYCK